MKLRGGECLGTLQTLVAPGCTIPRSITVLTGITDAMVMPAPPVEAVLPTLARVHRRRRDRRSQRPLRRRLPQRRAPTIRACAARQPDHRHVRARSPPRPRGGSRLQARHARRPVPPSAPADAPGPRRRARHRRPAARAPRAGRGVRRARPRRPHRAADDGSPSAGCEAAPHRDAAARAWRLPLPRPRRPRACTSARPRTSERVCARTSRPTTVARSARCSARCNPIDHVVCRSTLEAAVLESRLIAQLLPRYNRRGTRWKKYVYVKLTAEPFPRLAVVRAPKRRRRALPRPAAVHACGSARRRCHRDGRSTAAVHRRRAPGRAVRESRRAPRPSSVRRCVRAPGASRSTTTRAVATRVVRGLTCEPELLLEPLRERMSAWPMPSGSRKPLMCATGPPRSRPRSPGSGACCSFATAGGSSSISARPAASSSTGAASPERGSTASSRWGSPSAAVRRRRAGAQSADGWIPVDVADELACVASWLDANAPKVRLVQCDGRTRFDASPPCPRSLCLASVFGVDWVLVALLIVTTVFCAQCASPACCGSAIACGASSACGPSTQSPAPTGWALSTSEPARLHRRLRRVAASARLSGIERRLDHRVARRPGGGRSRPARDLPRRVEPRVAHGPRRPTPDDGADHRARAPRRAARDERRRAHHDRRR